MVTVLHVEDDAADIAIVGRYLGSSFAISNATTIDAAMQQLAQQQIDVVLLDLGLPDSEGLSGLRRIKQDFPTMPVVILTEHDDEQLGLDAVAQGAEDFVSKSRSNQGDFNGEFLIRTIRYARARATKDKARQMLEAHRSDNDTVWDVDEYKPSNLRSRDSAAFLNLVALYSKCLEEILASGKSHVHGSDQLTLLIRELARLHADTSDVVDIHTQSIQQSSWGQQAANKNFSLIERKLLLYTLAHLDSPAA